MLKMKTAGAAAAVLLLLGSALAVGAADTPNCLPDMEPVLKEMREMRALLDKQGEELRQAKTQLQAMQTSRSGNEASMVQELWREREKSRVSFSTSLAISGLTDLGPNSTPVPLVFKHVITNVGNAYNPSTGVFTAPVRGVYHFLIFAVGFGHASRMTSVYLLKNGQQVVIASSQQSTGRVDTSNAASLLLEVGDVVSVNLMANAWVHDSYNHHTTFSGHLLFPM